MTDRTPRPRRRPVLEEALAQQGLALSPRPALPSADAPLRVPARELEREEARERLRRLRERLQQGHSAHG